MGALILLPRTEGIRPAARFCPLAKMPVRGVSRAHFAGPQGKPNAQLFLSNARMKSHSFSTPSVGMAL